MSNIQYYYECLSAANDAQNENDILYDEEDALNDQGTINGCNKEELGTGFMEDDEAGLTEEGLASLLTTEISAAERIHAIHALECAKYAGIFAHENKLWIVNKSSAISAALGEDILKLQEWKQQMTEDVVKQNTGMDIDTTCDINPCTSNRHTGPSVIRSCELSLDRSEGSSKSPLTDEGLKPVHPTLLNEEQRRAYEIIINHLEDTLAHREPPCLRMILYGEGGTGKSKVIQTVTQAFINRGVKDMLVKAAYTGVAASLIDGKTTHTLASLNLRTDDSVSPETKKKLQNLWKNKQYLILDEYSMIGKSFLAKLSKNICIGKVGSASVKHDVSFGGVNVILCGDLHQFPPVAQSLRESLFKPTDMVNDTNERKIGRSIYEEFDTVVILKKQMRVSDPVWAEFLSRLRHGRVRDDDISMLKGLILGDEEKPTEFGRPPWSDAPLVTPRHAVCQDWNRHATRKHCTATGHKLFICEAEDRVGSRLLSLAERYAVARKKLTEKKSKKKELPREIELAIGMKVLVTDNLETDLDITNGARGTVVRIILHPEEVLPENDAIIKLKHQPVCVLVKLERMRASRLNGLEDDVIPIEATTTRFTISMRNKTGKIMQRTIQRQQFPITAAYSVTDYRAQGQTIPSVIVDIASPPSSTLSLFNLYVALSRSTGRSSIRLLRAFQEKLFLQSHDLDLLREDDRLETKNEESRKKTKKRKNSEMGM